MKSEKLIIGEPVKPMLVSETAGEEKYKEIIKEHKKSLVEVKSDGYRIQVHNNGDLAFFTRNLNSINPNLYPEVKKQLKNLPQGIFDGELVGIEDGIIGFNAVKKRMKDSLDIKLVNEYPLQVKFFDVLFIDDKDIIDQPLYKRRAILEKYLGNLSEQEEISDSIKLKEKFEAVTSRGLEGLVCKNPDSQYLIGQRTKDWIKLKKYLTLDLTVLGIYQGNGKASKLPFAALLLGTRNKNNYETITKVGISNKYFIDSVYNKIKDSLSEKIPRNVIISDEINKKTYAKKQPLYYINPENSVVIETEALNITKSKNWHSCGLDESGKAYSLRIPIVKILRDDKIPRDCTTTSQVEDLYSG